MWLALAKAQGHEKAAKGRDVVKAKMTRVEISKARDLASLWWREHN